MPSGLIAIEVMNQGAEVHHAQLVRLAAGKTPADFAAAMKADPEHPPTWVTFVGVPNAVVPGDRATAVMELQPGQHLDLIGSYAPHMREADDDCIRRAKVWIDTEAALYETGDLIKPLESGALTKAAICGTLYDLCKPAFALERKYSDITLFKGVGHALEDLAAAKLALSSIAY